MIRLFLLFIIIAVGMSIIVMTVQTAERVSSEFAATKGEAMPKAVSTVAYVLLFLLMLGVATGFLGGA